MPSATQPDAPTVSQAIQALLRYSERRTSERTVGFYRERLKIFNAVYGDRSIAGITTLDIEEFITGLLQRNARYANHPYRKRLEGPLSISYINGFERAIRRLLYFSEKRGWIPAGTNPWRNYEPVPKDRRLQPKSCDIENVSRLLAVTEGSSVAEVRDRTILYILLDTGCRLGGLANLQIDDIDWENRTFRTFKKGAHSTYAFSERAAEQLRKWIEVREKFLGGEL